MEEKVKIIIKLELKQNELPLDYRRACVSFIKSSLCDKMPELFNEFYKSNKEKNFAFDLKMNNPKFEEDKILLDNNKLLFTIITNDFGLGIDFYNCFLARRAKEHPLANGNSMKISDINLNNHKNIESSRVRIKFFSPVVVRDHEKGEKDKYYLFGDEKFNDGLNICVENQLKNCGLSTMDSEIKLIPVFARKVIVKSFGISIPGSIGIFDLAGDRETINAIYQMGIGSRRSEGFGTFEIVG